MRRRKRMWKRKGEGEEVNKYTRQEQECNRYTTRGQE